MSEADVPVPRAPTHGGARTLLSPRRSVCRLRRLVFSLLRL